MAACEGVTHCDLMHSFLFSPLFFRKSIQGLREIKIIILHFVILRRSTPLALLMMYS